MALIDNLKGSWKFDEASGNAFDVSGFGNTLLNSGTTPYAAGVINNGINFVTMASTNVLYIAGTGMAGLNAAVGNQYTVGVWFVPNTTPTAVLGVGRILDIGGAGFITLEYNHNGANVGIRVATGGGTNISHAVTLSNGTRYLLVVTCGTDNVTRLYINNVQVGSDGTNGGVSSGLNFGVGNANNSIGTNANSTGGLIDELYLAQQELDSTERSLLYNFGVGLQYPFTSPGLVTNPVTSISTTTAIGNAEIGSDGGLTIIERGFVWGLSILPTTANSKVTASGTVGVYSGALTSLAVNTLYYVRSYYVNSLGTTYGNEVTFTTLNIPQYQLQYPITVTSGETFIGRVTVTGTVGTVTVQLGTTGTSTVIAAGAGATAFSGTYSGLSGFIITRSATFNGTVDDFYFARTPLDVVINWSLDTVAIVTAVAASVLFKRVEDQLFNNFRFYRYLDLLFKDLDGYVTVTVREEREDNTTDKTKTFVVGNINSGTVSPFQKKRISFLCKDQSIIIGLSNGNLNETFSIAQFLLIGDKKPRRTISPSKIISLP